MTARTTPALHRALRLAAGLLASLALLAPAPRAAAQAVPTGFQEYRVVGDEQQVWDIYRNIVAGGGIFAFRIQNVMASVVSITASTDNQVLFYDHWEDGFDAGSVAAPGQASTLVLGNSNLADGRACDFLANVTCNGNPANDDVLREGDNVSLASDGGVGTVPATCGGPLNFSGCVPVNVPGFGTGGPGGNGGRNPAFIRYDGGDRVFASGGPVSMVHLQEPQLSFLTFFPLPNQIGGAIEILPRQAVAAATAYTIPVGVDTFTRFGGADTPGEPFKSVELQLVAFDDGTSVQVTSPGAGTVNFVLNRGQHYSSLGHIGGLAGTPSGIAAPAIVVNEGTKIATSKPIAGMFIAGGDGAYASRTYAILPDILHGNDYILTAPGDAGQNSPANAYVFNPDPVNPITVAITDVNGSRNVLVPPGQSVAYGPPGTFLPTNSTARLTSDRNFWGISAYDSQNTAFDWGHSWLATRFLGTTYTAPRAPTVGNTAALYVAPIENNTCVRVDFDNDGVNDRNGNGAGGLVAFSPSPACADGYLVNVLSALLVIDPDGDATGARIRADKKVAIAFGLETDTTAGTVAAPDLGYAVYPTLQLFLDPVLNVTKSTDASSVATAGGTVTYTLEVDAFAFGDLTNLELLDLTPPGGDYVEGSTVITRPDLSTISGPAAEPVQTPQPGPPPVRTTLDWSAALVTADPVPLPLPLAANERLTLEYQVNFPGPLPAGGVLINDARANADLGGSTFSPIDSATVVVTDLTVTKAVTDDGTPEPGEVLSYAITVDNPGPLQNGVVITDPVPAGTTFCDALTPPPGSCAAIASPPPFTASFVPAQNAVVWTAPALAANSGPFVLGFDARINPNAPAGLVIANTASTETAAVSAFPSNTVQSTVVGPELVVGKSIVGGLNPVHPGEIVSFEVTVANVGDGTADNLLIVDPIPATAAYRTQSMRWKLNAGVFQPLTDGPGPDAGGADAVLNGGQLEFRLPALGPGQDLTFRFDVTVTGASGQTLANQATVSSDEVQPKDTPLAQALIDGDATIAGHLFLDLDGNGSQNPGEPDLSNVDVVVTDEDGGVQVVTTNSSGDFSVVVPADNLVTPGLTSLDVDETDPDFPANATLIAVGATNPPGCLGAKVDPQVVVAFAGISVTACERGFQPAAITVTKTSDAPASGVQPGATLTYTVTVDNTSGVNQSNVSVTDVLPAGVSFVPGSTQIAAPAIRVTEYFLDVGEFTGTTFDLTLKQDLQADYFVILQGSDGNGDSGAPPSNDDRGPDENYARLVQDPFGTGELAASSGADVIRLARGNAVDSWVGVVTVVESLPNAGADGFVLRDVREVAHPGTDTAGSEAITGAWADIGQVQLVGGYNGAGCSTAEPSPTNTKVCHVLLSPSGTATIDWSRDPNGATLATAASTVMAVEWGSDWTVQRAQVVNGNNGGNGAGVLADYNTAALGTPVARDDTWVWGTGHSNDTSTGNASEGVLVTLGDGVNQNATESSVAVGIESNNKSVDFEVWALTHPGLAVDYRFKSDGDIALEQVDVTVDSQPFNRMALASNGTTGNQDRYPRPMFSARYVDPTTVRLERRRSGENFPAWVQGIGFAGVTSLSAGGALPPNPASGTLASGFELPPGGSLTVSFQVSVDDPLAGGITALTNNATVTTDTVPGGVSDGVTDPVVRPEVSVEPNAALALLSDNGSGPLLGPLTATFTHTVRNTGDQPDSYALAAFSAGARKLELLNPATGVVIATDSNGDGVWDGATPNTGTLTPGQSATFRLRVTLSAGTTVGSEDTLRLRATSDGFSAVSAEAIDELRLVAGDPAGAGDVLVTPDHSSFATAGQKVVYTHRITNNTGAPRKFALSAISSRAAQGYAAKVYRDSNGNGLFDSGIDIAITSTLTLANGASQRVFLTVDVPLGAAIGEVDNATLTASFFDDNGTPGVFTDDIEFGGTASDTTTVSGETNPQLGFNLSGGGTQVVNPGDTAIYPGELDNTGDATDRYEFSLTASVYADGLGAPGNQPDDGLPHASELVLLDPDGNGVIDTPALVVARDSTGNGVWDLIDVDGDGTLDDPLLTGAGAFDLDDDGLPDFPVAAGVSSPYELRRAVSISQGAYSDPVTLAATSTGTGKVDSVTATTSVQAATLAAVGALTAWDDGSGTVVRWVTHSEHGTVGFTLERQDPASGDWLAVNEELLPALLHSRHGGEYRLRDRAVRAGDGATYRLLELEATGATVEHGPYPVTVGATAPPALDPLRAERPLPGFERVARSLGALADAREARKLEARAEAALARASRRGEVIEIGVRDAGVYRLTAARLAGALGEPETRVREAIRGNALVLRRGGRAVATLAEGDDALLFYGEAIVSQYTRDNVYRLEAGRGLRMSQLHAGSPAASPGQSSLFTAHAEGNRYYLTHLFDDPDGDYWMWDFRFQDLVFDFNDASFPVPTPDPAPAGRAEVTVRLHGALEARHRARIALGATSVETEWQGLVPHTVRFEVDAAALADGETPVTVEGLGSGDPSRPSTFYINDVDIRYPRLHLAAGGERTLEHAPGAVTSIDGFAGADVRVLELGAPDRPRLMRRVTLDATPAGTRVSVAPRVSAPGRLLAFDASAVREPAWVEADRASNLRWDGHRVDWLLITSADMVEAAGVLAAHRESQGLRTMVVDVDDVYDEFAFGVRDADAIWAFLRHAWEHWSVAPRYVVLGGEGSFDYKDYLGHGDSIIPTLLAPGTDGLSPSDNLFADVDGNDFVPEMAIGRLPVIDAAEMTAVANKLIAYESSAGAWTGQAVFGADPQDAGGDFAAASERVLEELPPGLLEVERMYLDPQLLPAGVARTRLHERLNEGLAFFNFFGHANSGSIGNLNPGLINAGDLLADAGPIANGETLPVVTAFTCLVGQFGFPGDDGVGELLLVRPDRGAAAVFSPSGLSRTGLAERLGRGFYDASFGDGELVIGEAILRAQAAYAAQGGDVHLLDIYNLLGDPATIMK